MRCIQFDNLIPTRAAALDAYHVRAGYLLSDCIYMLGQSTFLITFEAVVKSFSLNEKIHMLLQSPNLDETLKSSLDSFLLIQKQLKSFKHPPNNVFLAGKKISSVIVKSIEEWIASFKSVLAREGFAGLIDLEEKDVFNLYNASPLTKDSTEAETNGLELFTNRGEPLEVNSLIWFMPDYFYSRINYPEGVSLTVDTLVGGMPYLIKGLTLPNLIILTITELQALKNQLKSALKTIRTETDEWAMKCYTEGNGASYFVENILPELAKVERAFSENAIIKHLKSIETGRFSLDMYFGEMTPQQLWKFNTDYGNLPIELIDCLEKDYAEMPSYTIPIILFVQSEIGLVLFKEDGEEDTDSGTNQDDILTVKKYIDID